MYHPKQKCVHDSFALKGKRSFFRISEADFFSVWLGILFAFYFCCQKSLILCKTYYKNLELCVHLIITSFIRWSWLGFHGVDWKIYLSADWPLALPGGVFLCTVTWVPVETSACKWSGSACECSCCRAGGQFTACCHPCQDFQCWACWNTRMGSYGLTALSCFGVFAFLSCESLCTHWCSWLTQKSPALSVHSIRSSIQSTPMSALARMI